MRKALLILMSACSAAVSAQKSVTQERMREIYEEVKTPYKYGVVMEAPDNKDMVDCPTVFRDGDRWCMTYVLFDGRGYETWIAYSDDLLHWKPQGRLLKFAEEGWDKNQRGGFPALQDMEWGGSYRLGEYEGRHWMTYIGSSTPGYEGVPISIGLASTAGKPSEVREWQTYNRPVMAWNDADTLWWESHSPYKSSVYEVKNPLGSRFLMFYNAAYMGKRHNRGERIGIATSDDLRHWKRYPGNPVFQHDYNKTITGDAQIQRMGDLYVMFYYCAHNPKMPYGAYNSFAASYDLVNWTDWTGDVLVRPSEKYDARYAHKSFVLKHDGVVYHFYCAVDDARHRTIALTTSRDMRPEAQPAYVAKYYGDRRAAVTYTFDDGLSEHYTMVFPEFEKRGLKGTFAIVGNKVGHDMKGNPCLTWAQLREMAAAGHEMSNHGWNHQAVHRLSPEALRAEVQHNDTVIYERTGVFPRTFVYPGNRKTPEAVAFCSKDRTGTRTRQVSVGSKRDSAWLRQWADGLVERGEWGIGMTHGITQGYDAIGDPARFWKHLDYVCSLRDSLWVGTLRDVSAYVCERDAVRLDIRRTGNGMTVTPRLNLDRRIYNHPLTLVVPAPGITEATQDGRRLDVTVRGGKAVMDFDPYGGKIEMKVKK